MEQMKTIEKPHVLGLAPSELKLMIADEPAYRTAQVEDWIYDKKVFDPDQMTNLTKSLREQLKAKLDWSLPQVVDRVDSSDGSSKLLLRNRRGHVMEAVLMRYDNRTSLCVSSQVGCKLACDFCQTGKMGFMSHLTQDEILGQFAVAVCLLRSESPERRLSHVVFMGMGEPFDNYANAVGAANVMIASFGLSRKNVTLSTSGIAPRIEQLAQDSDAALALSLHACRDDLRSRLMPINRKYPLATLKTALLNYQAATDRLITLEYIMIRDLNVSLREAKELVKFVHGLRVKVNLIPFNSHPGMDYQRPSDEEIRAFQLYLADRSIPAPVRYSKGLDVSAACGQLAAKHKDILEEMPSRRNLTLYGTRAIPNSRMAALRENRI